MSVFTLNPGDNIREQEVTYHTRRRDNFMKAARDLRDSTIRGRYAVIRDLVSMARYENRIAMNHKRAIR